MQLLLTILSVLVVLGTAGIMLYDLKTKKYEFLSLRNIFLLGFAHFFGIGTYFTAVSGYGTDLYTAGEKGWRMLFIGTLLFIIVFTIAQRFGRSWRWVGKVIPAVQLPITQMGINLSIVALLAGAFLGAVLPNSGYLAAMYSQFRGGMAGAAVGLACYNLLARRFNPVAWVVFIGTLGAAVLVSTVGDIGRRSLLGVMLAVGWIWYYFSLRYRRVTPTLIKVGTLMLAAFFALVIYAGFRGQGAGAGVGRGGFSLQTRFQQIAEAITNPTVSSGDVQSSIMSDAPTNSMFIMENYPERFPYDPFNGVKFILANPIPRFLWPEKPIGLGITVQHQLGSPANLGVGILGHGWAEGGWIGIIGYALFFGVLAASMDSLVKERMWNPYFHVAIACALGNVYAIPRGETSLMLLQVVNGFVGVIVILYMLKLFLRPIMEASAPLLIPIAHSPEEPHHYEDEYTPTSDEYPSWSGYDGPESDRSERTHAA